MARLIPFSNHSHSIGYDKLVAGFASRHHDGDQVTVLHCLDEFGQFLVQKPQILGAEKDKQMDEDLISRKYVHIFIISFTI